MNSEPSKASISSNAFSSTNTTQTLTADELKKQERLKKLEAWKKKQAERKKQLEVKPVAKPQATSSIPVKPKAKFSLVKKAAATKEIKKPSLFTEEEEASSGKRSTLFVPKNLDLVLADDDHQEGPEADFAMKDTGEDENENEVDALDAFMTELEGGKSESSTSNELATNVKSEHFMDEDNKKELNGDGEDQDEATTLLRKLRKSKSKNINAPKYNLKEMEPIVKSIIPAIESITQDDIINFRALNNIYITDKSITPVLNFYHFGLDSATLTTLTSHFKYTTPTPIQSQTIPAIMSGRDVIGIGKTGSGKTMCYLLGLLKHIKLQKPLAKAESGPLGLILSPTRELAIQIHDNLQPFLKDSSLRAICCTGGSELQTQITELKRGVHIIIATPGRFIDLLTLNNGRLLSPRRISFVTMDEADRLFDLGFEPQITQIMKTIRPDKQTVLFSATFPKKLQQFATKSLNRAISIGVGDKQEVNPNVTQDIRYVDTEYDKFQSLLHILGQISSTEKCLIFCDSQTQVNSLFNQLSNRQYPVVAIHAGLTPIERTNNLQKFKKSSTSNILIATEVLSRGLDVHSLSLVILFNPAKTFAQYVHSTGRTGRGEAKGSAISLICKGEGLQSYIVRKFMDEDKLPEEVKTMAGEFEKDLKDGKVRVNLGYGGKGLERLDQVREDEQKHAQGDSQVTNSPTPTLDTQSESHEPQEELNLDVTYEDHASVFKAKLTINDLPQNVRWLATNNAALSRIVDETGTSITYKGQYVPPGEKVKEGVEKLYLLIEAKESDKVRDGVRLCQAFILDGLKKEQNGNRGKFTL